MNNNQENILIQDKTVEIEKTEEIEKEVVQKTQPNPVVYSDLLKKIRQTETDLDNQTKPTKVTNRLNPKPNSKSNSKSNGKFNKSQLPRLSKEDYQRELENCQKVFMNELKRYLVENVSEKRTNQNTQEIKDKKYSTNYDLKSKKQQITNMEKINNGINSINIVRVICSRVEGNKLDFIEKLITNRKMNFFETLTDYMAKFNIMTTYKSPKVILLHSPYLKV